MGKLCFAKVCARWVPRQLTDAHKQARLEACLELLECHAGDETFFQLIVTRDGFITMSLSLREHPWNGVTLALKVQRNSSVCARLEFMETVFWDVEGVILVDFMPQRTTINLDVYVGTLRKLKARLKSAT